MPRCSLICLGPEDHAGLARQQGDVERCDPWKGLRALVVDDDPHGCDLLVRCLEGVGLRTCVANGDEAALKILEQAGTERVLLDAACRLWAGYIIKPYQTSDVRTQVIEVLEKKAAKARVPVLPRFQAGVPFSG